MQCTSVVLLRRVRVTIATAEKTISITYSHCVLIALGIQNAMRMRYIVICCLPRSTMRFPHCVTNCTIFEKKKNLLNIKCVF
jgi:hypothetical protein